MKRLKNTFLNILLIMVMLLGLVPLNSVSALNYDAKVSYNLNSTQMPMLTFYRGTDLAEDVSTPLKEISVPSDSYFIFFFIDESVNKIETAQSYVMIDGRKFDIGSKGIIWDQNKEVEGKKYTLLGIALEEIFGKENITVGTFKNIEAHLHYRDFSIKTHKNLIGNNQEEMNESLNQNPSEYRLYNEEGTIEFKGIATTQDVIWEVVKGDQKFISEDKKNVQNLPDGQYTLMETNVGGNFETLSGSKSSWLNASLLKEKNENKFYTFEVNEETIDDWMYSANFDGVKNQLTFDFNSNEKTPEIPEVPETPDVPNVPEQPNTPDVPNVPEQPDVPVIPGITESPIVTIVPVVTQPVVRDNNLNTDNVITEIEDNDTPLGQAPTDVITDEKAPLAKGVGEGDWALINLICTIATALVAVMVILIKNKKDDNQQKHSFQGWTKIISIIVATGSILMFVFTENMTLTMAMFDKWTIVMVLILIVQVIVAFITKKSNNDDSYVEASYNV